MKYRIACASRRALFAAVFVLAGLSAGPAGAVTTIDIYGAGQNVVNLAMATPINAGGSPVSGLGAELHKAIEENLGFLPFVRLTNAQAVLGGVALSAYQMPGIDFKRFQLAGADRLITAGWPGGDTDGGVVELRLFETASGQFLFGNSYKVPKDRVYDVADRFCADLMKHLSGRGDFFLSTLAFVKTGQGKYRKDIWMSKPTGRDIRQVSNIEGTALSPAWSRDGRFVVFTHIDTQSHSLGVWDRTTNQLQRIRFPGNLVIAPSFTPDNRVAVSLATTDYPDIYLLDYRFQKEQTLEAGPSINIAPTFDSTGTRMAFCSSRLGGPQIFLKDLKSGAITRISRQGDYNTEPFISPDGTLIAFSRLTDSGHRIFVYDLVTGFERQVTFGPGSDEQPSFAPDSYFLAFSSTRSGPRRIYLTTRHGGDAKHVPTGGGEASFPRWGLLP
ncbi:MAG: translocation protein TolB [Deltaproteobacteria bacterium]|jgi:TolB protein|nr:translocation protein TolB [Deltaproteobacteria bacterium]